MEEDSQHDLNAESNSKIIHFLANLIMSGRKEAPSLSQADSFQANRFAIGKSPAMQFEVSKRNKMIINFVNIKRDAEAGEADDKEDNEAGAKEESEVAKTTEKSKEKKSIFKRWFSGKKKNIEKEKKEAPKQAPVRKFENVRVLMSQNEREKLFGDFHRIMYDQFIQKFTKIVNKNENSKIAAEICKMNSYLSNSCSNKHLRRVLGEPDKPATEEGPDCTPKEPKQEGPIKEESFENVRNSELENWYFDLESLTKIVNCLN